MTQFYYISGTNCIGKTQWMIRHFGAGLPEGTLGEIDPKQHFVWHETRFHVALQTEASTRRLQTYYAAWQKTEAAIVHLQHQLDRMTRDMEEKQTVMDQYTSLDKTILKLVKTARDAWGVFHEERLTQKDREQLIRLRDRRNALEGQLSPFTEPMVRKKTRQLNHLQKVAVRSREKMRIFLQEKVCDLFIEISCHGDQMVMQLHHLRDFITQHHLHVRNFFINGGVGWNIVQNIRCKRLYRIPNFTTHTYDELAYIVPPAETVYIENRTDGKNVTVEPIDMEGTS